VAMAKVIVQAIQRVLELIPRLYRSGSRAGFLGIASFDLQALIPKEIRQSYP
jgi:hypothetical protein